MCKALKQDQPSISSLTSLLPKTKVVQEGDCADWVAWADESEEAAALEALRDAAGNCPACILSALRQAKIPVPLLTGFSYKSESDEIWRQIQQDRESQYEYY